MKSLIMPKFFPSVSLYSFFRRTRFNRERYIFYKPLLRNTPFPESDSDSDPKLINSKLLPKPSLSSNVPEVALLSALYSSSVLYFEMMECYASLAFRIAERASIFDLINYPKPKISFSSILSLLDIWKRKRMMKVPFRVITSWYLKINDIDLRFVNKYLPLHCFRVEREINVAKNDTESAEIFIHPKVLKAEKKFVKNEITSFAHFRDTASIFSRNDRFLNTKRKGFHCYFISPHNKLLKNRRFQNNILSKRFWGTLRRHKYNASLQQLVNKKLYSWEAFHGFRSQKINISDNSEITSNYSYFFKYYNDLDDYIGHGDVGLVNCKHARPVEICYNAVKQIHVAMTSTFFNLVNKCSRIKKWLLKKYIPNLAKFFEMLFELIQIVSCKDIEDKAGERGSIFKRISSSKRLHEKKSFSDVSSSESSIIGKIYRSFSRGRVLYLKKHRGHKVWINRVASLRKAKRNKRRAFRSNKLFQLSKIPLISLNRIRFPHLTTFANAFINKYSKNINGFQVVDFIKYRLPTRIEKKTNRLTNLIKKFKKQGLIRGLSQVVVGKDRTFDKLMTFIRPSLYESSTLTTPVAKHEGRRTVSEAVLRPHHKRLPGGKSNYSLIQKDGREQKLFPSPHEIKTPKTFPNLLDGHSLKISESITLKHGFMPFLNPIIQYLIYIFSSKMFIKYKELNFLQNYLMLGKKLVKRFRKLKKTGSLLRFRSRTSMKRVKSRSSVSSRLVKPSILNIRKRSTERKRKKQKIKKKKFILKQERDMRYYLATHLGYLSCLLRSIVDRELSKAGFHDSDKSWISKSTLATLESLDSPPKTFLSPDLYKVVHPIKRKHKKNARPEEVRSTASSASHHRIAIQPSLRKISFSTYTSTSGSFFLRRIPLTLDNVITFKTAMSTLFEKIRLHIIDLIKYPIENSFTCLGDFRVPTMTQTILEFCTQSILPEISDSEYTKSTETLSLKNPKSRENILINPSGSVLNITSKLISGSRESYLRDQYSEEKIIDNKYFLFQHFISESFYCLLPPKFINAIENLKKKSEHGSILNPLYINRNYYKAVRRYYRQIERIVYKEESYSEKKANNITLNHTGQKKNQKDVYFLNFLLELAKKFVDLTLR